MTSLFMGHLVGNGVPADEKVVRSTATPVDNDAPAAMAVDQPTMNEDDFDPNPNLGMVNRTKASTWHTGTKVRPQWIEEANGVTASFDVINNQVATSGTAAAREAAGVVNPNLSYAVGIEPVQGLVDGGRLTNTYFVRHERPVQDGMGHMVTPIPPGLSSNTNAHVDQAAKTAARDAAAGALYNAFWNGGQ